MNEFYIMPDRDFSNGRDYIGASDMGCLCGLTDENKTSFKLYEELTGQREAFKGNEATKWGHALEPIVLHEWISRKYGEEHADRWLSSRIKGSSKHKMKNGVTVHSFTEAKSTIFVNGYAHTDLLVVPPEDPEHPLHEEPFVVQAKTTTVYNKRDYSGLKGYNMSDTTPKGCPLATFLQEQWEMHCYGVNKSLVVCLMGGQEWQEFGPITYNKDIVQRLAAKGQEMWRHKEALEPVMPGDFDDIKSIFPEVDEKISATVPAEIEAAAVANLENYRAIKRRIKALEEKKDDIKKGYALAMGQAKYLEDGSGNRLASQVTKSWMSLDNKRLKEEQPEIYEKYKTKVNEQRYVKVCA